MVRRKWKHTVDRGGGGGGGGLGPSISNISEMDIFSNIIIIINSQFMNACSLRSLKTRTVQLLLQ